MKYLLALVLTLLPACLDEPPEARETSRTDDLCWNITILEQCAVLSCPLGISDQPILIVPCTDKGDSTLCFCRQVEGQSPLCGLHSQVWIYNC